MFGETCTKKTQKNGNSPEPNLVPNNIVNKLAAPFTIAASMAFLCPRQL